ncbi:hypothetical protein ELUMI_v1c03770 [Williamsoniiplasma luminosum]|uniref:Uncharacterized protein n=1 Tax=Williamsoniiplasma luminosum TaxID=214888 RepID=A0A2K8NTD4_9MOLU|nr:hypothetical protein [Williamsoniiplasma luminosum]ATZ17102.1 hypothetical protein ELUMI_v1c03770 [Williamsoniiplasma luminosum]
MNKKGISILGAVWIGFVASYTFAWFLPLTMSLIPDGWGSEGVIVSSVVLMLGTIYLVGFVLYHKNIIKGKIWKYLFPNKKPLIYKDMFKLNWISLFLSISWLILAFALFQLLWSFGDNISDWPIPLLVIVIVWFVIGFLGFIGSMGAILTNYNPDNLSKLGKYFS